MNTRAAASSMERRQRTMTGARTRETGSPSNMRPHISSGMVRRGVHAFLYRFCDAWGLCPHAPALARSGKSHDAGMRRTGCCCAYALEHSMAGRKSGVLMTGDAAAQAGADGC